VCMYVCVWKWSVKIRKNTTNERHIIHISPRGSVDVTKTAGERWSICQRYSPSSSVWNDDCTLPDPRSSQLWRDPVCSRHSVKQTRLRKVIREQAASPSLAADTLIAAAAHSCSTVLARWRQCARPSNTSFLEPMPLTIPNGSSTGSAVSVCWLVYKQH